MLAALCLVPGARAQVEGTSVATEPAFGSITVVTVDQGGSAPGFFAANGTCSGADGTVTDTCQPAANARNGQPAVTTAQGTRDAATRLGTDLPLVATNALSASVRGNAERG
jgi:hypothetical protein